MASADKSLPLATIGGFLVILLFCIFTLASAVRYPVAFSPMDNWLSDLGTNEEEPCRLCLFQRGLYPHGRLDAVPGIGYIRLTEFREIPPQIWLVPLISFKNKA